jgi:hypothetical protein
MTTFHPFVGDALGQLDNAYLFRSQGSSFPSRLMMGSVCPARLCGSSESDSASSRKRSDDMPQNRFQSAIRVSDRQPHARKVADSPTLQQTASKFVSRAAPLSCFEAQLRSVKVSEILEQCHRLPHTVRHTSHCAAAGQWNTVFVRISREWL